MLNGDHGSNGHVLLLKCDDRGVFSVEVIGATKTKSQSNPLILLVPPSAGML